MLLKRKGEGTLESLERRRREYVGISGKILQEFAIVDASRPLDIVTRDVADVIGAFSRGETAWRPGRRGEPVVSPRVLVTDAARGCAIAIIRSLGRRGFT